MEMNGIQTRNCLMGYRMKYCEKKAKGKAYSITAKKDSHPINADKAGYPLSANGIGRPIRNQMPLRDINIPSLKENRGQNAGEEASISSETDCPKTDTAIIVKPDGSRVLCVTVRLGGMETTMSIELSKPTNLPNECKENHPNASEQGTEHNGTPLGKTAASESQMPLRAQDFTQCTPE